MRRRRKSKTPPNELRSLALAGRREDVRALLEVRLARAPQDAEAREELERLNQGLPLRAEESALTRRRREEREMQEELAAELELYRRNPEMPEEWTPQLLRRRRKRVASIRATLGERLPEAMAEEAAAYHATLTTRCARLLSHKRRIVLFGIVLPLALVGAAALVNHQREQAGRAEEGLRNALKAQSLQLVDFSLSTADSGINRLMNGRLENLIREARTWQARVQRQEAEVSRALAELECGKTHISTLPLARRALLEQNLRSLPPAMETLRERWQSLCDKESQALAAQREEVRQRFLTPLPAMPVLSGNPAEDDAAVLAQQKEMQAQARDWEAAQQLFGFDPALGAPLRARLLALAQLRSDIAQLRRCLALLPSARSYAQYRERLKALCPKIYAPARHLREFAADLPDEDKLRGSMQRHGRELTPGMEEAARHALLSGGPSITPAFPASAQQLQLMEDLFTYSGLHKAFYELSAPTLGAFLVEERPQAQEGSVSFTPSPLTPGYSLDVPRRITWHNAQGVYMRRIDATPIVRACGLRREDFFRSANLPATLDALLHLEPAECPALARAFVFKRLLAVMRAHEWPMMLGLACAPTLRADARSFASLCHELGIPLEAGCWLRNDAETARAEELCTRWLRERRHRQYAQEIARNYGALVQVHPRYVGFVSADGHPQFFRQLPEHTLLWYLSASGLTTSPQNEALENPLPYSPLFIVARD